ncbi:unnamed protein product, partial [Polarella glacialis]
QSPHRLAGRAVVEFRRDLACMIGQRSGLSAGGALLSGGKGKEKLDEIPAQPSAKDEWEDDELWEIRGKIITRLVAHRSGDSDIRTDPDEKESGNAESVG